MANLDQYLATAKVTQTAVAQRAGITSGMISAFRSGRRRPSPEVALRIEAATDGNVSAASLLGVEDGARKSFQRQDGKWVVEVDGDGRAFLPAAMLQTYGIEPGERLIVAAHEFGFRVKSLRQVVEWTQEQSHKLVVPGVSVVDEYIAEQKVEAARE